MSDGPYRSPNADEFSEPLERPRSGIWRTIKSLLIVAAILAVAALLLLPTVRMSREAARRSSCSNNLKQIAIALQNYAEVYDALPPAYTVDADGKRLHSWRTLILPYFEQSKLYESIDLAKPWDDPVNAHALKTRIKQYQCPSAANLGDNETTYLAILASDSCLGVEPRKFSDITDGTNQTLLVTEVAQKFAVPWMAPTDADEDLLLGGGPDIQLPHPGGRNGVFVNGTVHFLPADLSARQLRALVSIAGNDDARLD